MGKCANHPDRETRYMCSKHGHYYCEECLECRDQKLYCKFRTACPIWFMMKETKSGRGDDQETDTALINEHCNLSMR